MDSNSSTVTSVNANPILTNGTDKPVALKPKRKFSLGWIGKKPPVEITEHAGRVNGAETKVMQIDADKKDEPMRATVKVTNKFDPNKCPNTRAKERRRKQMNRHSLTGLLAKEMMAMATHPLDKEVVDAFNGPALKYDRNRAA